MNLPITMNDVYKVIENSTSYFPSDLVEVICTYSFQCSKTQFEMLWDI